MTIPEPWRLPEEDEQREALALLDEQLPRTPANYSRAVRAIRLAAAGVRIGNKNDGSQN